MDKKSYVLGILTIVGIISFVGIAFADSEIGDRIVALWFHGNISNTTGYNYSNLTNVPAEIIRNDTAHYKNIAFSRDMSLASGLQSITGVGFKPSAIIVNCAVDGKSMASWGVADGGGGQSIYDNNLIVANSYSTNNVLIWIQNASSSYYASVSSYDSDGLTLSWTKSGSASGTVVCRGMVNR